MACIQAGSVSPRLTRRQAVVALSSLMASALRARAAAGASEAMVLALPRRSEGEILVKLAMVDDLSLAVWRSGIMKASFRVALYAKSGEPVWEQDMGAAPVVDAFGLPSGHLCVVSGNRAARTLLFDVYTRTGESVRRAIVNLEGLSSQFLAVHADARRAYVLDTSYRLLGAPFDSDVEAISAPALLAPNDRSEGAGPSWCSLHRFEGDRVALLDHVQAEAIVLGEQFTPIVRRNLAEVSDSVSQALQDQPAETEKRRSASRSAGHQGVSISLTPSVGFAASDGRNRLWIAPTRINVRALRLLALDDSLTPSAERTVDLSSVEAAGGAPPTLLAASPTRIALAFGTGAVAIYPL